MRLSFLRIVGALMPLLALSSCSDVSSSKSNTQDTVATEPVEKNPLQRYEMYCNARFDFCLLYPADLLNKDPESENGDGTIFLNKNREEKLRVWGERSSDSEGEEIPFNLKFVEVKKRILTSGEISHEQFLDSSFVISGTENGALFFLKSILKENGFVTAKLVYNSNEMELYAPAIKVLDNSLKN